MLFTRFDRMYGQQCTSTAVDVHERQITMHAEDTTNSTDNSEQYKIKEAYEHETPENPHRYCTHILR